MIIFDLDGTLADCERRRHFVDPTKNPDYEYSNFFKGKGSNFPKWQHKQNGKIFKPDWKAFYEACDKDLPIESTNELFKELYLSHAHTEIQIWSGRCESVRKKTLMWLDYHINPTYNFFDIIKMRPIGNSEPDEVLKERWLDEAIAQGKRIDFVFDDRPKVIRMWRRRGIFVFNCCQHEEEF